MKLSLIVTDNCDSNPCDDNASCESTEDSFICTCNEGFIGDGLSCAGENWCLDDKYMIQLLILTDIIECSIQPCDENASCENTAGSFTCTCNEGFTGNGFICTGIIIKN